MKAVAAIFGLMSVLSTAAFANVGDSPAYVASAKDIGALIAAIKTGTPAAANADVSCTDVVVIYTGGTMGSATAGRCSFAGHDVLECLNNMTGGTGIMSEPQQGITLESSLRELIDSQCTGG